MWAPADKLVIDIEDRQLLETWTRAHNAPQSVVMRCQVVLLAADGLGFNDMPVDDVLEKYWTRAKGEE